MTQVTAHATNFAGWRSAARSLLHRGVAPHAVEWIDAEDAGLFAQAQRGAAEPAEAAHAGASARVPRHVLDLLRSAARFRAPDRWSLLYRVLWRWCAGEREVMSEADIDGERLYRMARAVRIDTHKMHAFLRFRERPPTVGAPRFVSWFEPRHDILDEIAAHFARRMGGATFLIATPEGSMLWDGERLHEGPPAQRIEEIEDAGEGLWLAYYRSIFNPARLNTAAMEQHMPARYWKLMPEARLIPQLVSDAARGARITAQAQAVGAREGARIAIAAERAQPERALPSDLDACRRCPLWRQATQAVPGCGPRDARIMVVGEQPGDLEDLAGRPFVGPAGALLDRALRRADVARDALYLTNAVKHFKHEPRGKRRLHKTPAQQEMAACRPWLEQELAQRKPEVVIALGATALKSLLHASTVDLTGMLNQPVHVDGRWLIASYHPAYALRVPSPALQEQAFEAIVRSFTLAQSLLARPSPADLAHEAA
ncbi:MAG TPA: UdgX family uracil-DNA binding protein [Noviherbaspirillum sp.]|jgi:DNA polymerase|uniref:UdgX family uracil-DNA binding protein n=1 Tax=Noviherbaspirillum sp. TaxID=1926288 RepID=UPI002F947915